MDKECVFCQIVKKRQEDPEALFWTGIGHFSFITLEPLNPVTEGHVLILPTQHVESADVWPDLTGSAFGVAAQVSHSRIIKEYNLITSVGEAATQSIPHLHIHVVPRRENDGLHLPWTGQIKEMSNGDE